MLDYNKYVGKRVRIIGTDRKGQTYHSLVGKTGIIINCSNRHVGVRIEGQVNQSSRYGCYWFSTRDIEYIGGKDMESMNKERRELKGYEHIAVVELLDEFGRRVTEYNFALYDEAYVGNLVVVNPRSEENRVLGVIKEIRPANFDICKAEVITVVDTSNYEKRLQEERLIQRSKKLQEDIDKYLLRIGKTSEIYRGVAEKYKYSHPDLMKMVNELSKLEEEIHG